MPVVLTALVLLAAGAIMLSAFGRLFLLFRAVRRLFDGGHRAIASLLERVAGTVSAPTVSMLVDLDTVPTPVVHLRSCLAQRYRNLDVMAVTAAGRLPTDLMLAFDLRETATVPTGVIYRSQRDERLLVLVAADDHGTPGHRLALAADASSGELLCPVHPAWHLNSGAVADLAGSWVRRRDLHGAFGVVHPPASTIGRADRLVSIRADLLAAAGLGEGAAALGALGALASGRHGSIVGLVERSVYGRAGGLPGDVALPASWAGLAAAMMDDAHQRGLTPSVRIHPRPLGELDQQLGVSTRGLVELPPSRGAAPLVWRALRSAPLVPGLAVSGTIAAAVGLVTGQVSLDVVLVGASAPLVLATAIVVGLMMDDRALRPVRSTRTRLRLVVAALVAAGGGVVGSPLRWPAR